MQKTAKKRGKPSKAKALTTTRSFRMPLDLWDAMQSLADANQRSSAGELIIAMRNHVENAR